MNAPHPSVRRGSSRAALALVVALAAAVAALLAWALASPSGRPADARDAAGPSTLTSDVVDPALVGASPLEATEVSRAASDAQREALAGPQAAPVATLEWGGVLTDVLSGEAVAGASVTLSRGERAREAQSDDEGRFEFTWFEGLEARISIVHPGYVDLRSSAVDLEQPGVFALEPSAVLRGWIEPPPTGPAARAVAWAAVASSIRSWKRLEAPVDGEGRFEFRDLAAGEYALTALVPGSHVRAEAGLRLERGETLEVPLHALPGSLVEGRILVRGTWRAVAGASLLVEPQDAGLPRDHRRSSRVEALSDEAGRYRLEGLGAGRWELSIVSPWGGHETREIDVPESGVTVTFDIDLVGPASIAGRLVGEDVADLEVVAVSSRWRGPLERVVGGEPAEWLARALAGPDGSWQFDEVPAGTPLSLFARRPAGGEWRRSGRPNGHASLRALKPGERVAGIELLLVENAGLRGLVLDEDGAPVSRASVKLHARLDGNWLVVGRARSAQDGRFEVLDLATTSLVVQVEHPAFLSEQLPVEAAGPELPEVEVRLRRAGHLVGRAIDGQGFGVAGLPLAAVGCDAAGNVPEDRDAREIHRTTSDDYGNFLIRGLRDGHWLVVGSSFGWRQLESRPAVALTPTDTEVTLEMTPRERPLRASLAGTVVLAGGGVPSGLEVRGLRDGVLEIDGGTFRATGLVPTRHYLTLRADGHAERRVDRIDLKPGQLYDVGEIELLPSTRLTVSVRDEAGAPIDGARVRLAALPAEAGGAGPGVRALRPRRRAPGRYVSADATRHAWRLIVDKKGYRRHSAKVTVQAHDTQRIDVVLRAASGGN